MSALRLLAKSAANDDPDSPPTIAEHCREVYKAACSIWDCVERDLAGALQTDNAQLRAALRPLYLAAVLLHDIGKANSAFQDMVRADRGRSKVQPIRHEILGAAILVGHEPMREWAKTLLQHELNWEVVWAIGGHHLEMRGTKRPDEAQEPLFRTGNVPKEVAVYLSDDQIRQLLAAVKSVLQPGPPGGGDLPRLACLHLTTMEDEGNSLEPLIRRLVRESRQAWEELGSKPEFKRQLAVLKALVIAADVAGSALSAENKPVSAWAQEALASRIAGPLLDPVIQKGLKGKAPRRFQATVAESSKPATIVMAGCGNGKTTAAYMWAQKWAAGKKLFFAYPTTGTASAGFEDYLLAQDDLARALIHGRAWVDLRAMQDSPEDDPLETSARMDALLAWSQQVIACTVDTVLGLIQNQRRPLFSLPAIACGAFVFDEIHNYDRRLFGELLRFLTTFPGAPVLLMSATIPPKRLAAIREVLGERAGAPVCGDPELEARKRYRLEGRPDAEECWPDVEKALRVGQKVLWVCNRVKDARAVFRAAARSTGGAEVALYHSRLRYEDRVKRQKEVLRLFDPNTKSPCLVVATQVCEMSLDISADLMVTAIPPLPALVQRLGRLNRFAERDDPRLCLVYPFEGMPYHREEHRQQIQAAQRAIAALCGQPCSQAQLAEHLNRMEVQEEWTSSSSWLDGGWESEPLPPREADTSITVVMEDDLGDIARELGPATEGRWTTKRLVPWTIPMLFPKAFTWQRRVAGYLIAPKGTITYDPLEGAQWNLRDRT
ncbi:MAG: CRISPR-associated helicase Cas3' [Planctomycetes bacterium]|nr:CRISPR-associated helicase Cas3' [Planctomycetota bacterium]